ncbi:glycosyltransferase family 87 protein [Bacteroidota bacterium]
MKSFFSFKRNPNLTFYLIMFFLILYMVNHVFNGRFTMFDFQVYYRAAERILDGQNLYKIVSDGHYIFKYSPVSAVYFIPLSLLPLTVAKVIYWLASSAAFCIVLALFFRMGDPLKTIGGPARQNLLYLITFICLGAFLELEIHLGQVNIFILILLVVSAYSSRQNRPLVSGLLLAISVFLKPFGLILFAYYLYRSKFRESIYFLLFTAVLFFLPLMFFGSFEMFMEQSRLWLQEIQIEMHNKQDLLAHYNHTVFSVLARYTPLRWVEWTAVRTLVFQLTVLAIFGFLFILLRISNRSKEDIFPVELALVLCLIPLLAHTNKNLYLCCGMVNAVLLIRFFKLHWIYRSLFIIGILISSFNIIEIWGDELTFKLEAWSFIALGTLISWIVLYVSALQGLIRVSRKS